YTQVGSFLKVADAGGKLALLTSLTVFAFVYPTLPKLPGGQCLIGRWDNCSRQGYRLGVNKHGCLEFCVGRRKIIDCLEAEKPLFSPMWYFVEATLDAETGLATLYQEAIIKRYNGLLGPVALFDHLSDVSKVFKVRPNNLPGTPFLLAGSRDSDEVRGDFVS